MEPNGDNFNGHFIRHYDGNLCVDPVEPNDEDLAELDDGLNPGDKVGPFVVVGAPQRAPV